eukprot:m.332348 g.332348  ORF g.332348 m.332348 type:complete len:362 (-) comp16934_c0_seq1:406-1491(-)
MRPYNQCKLHCLYMECVWRLIGISINKMLIKMVSISLFCCLALSNGFHNSTVDALGETDWMSEDKQQINNRERRGTVLDGSCGEKTHASGVCAFVFGHNVMASTHFSIAMGDETKASGLISTAMGLQTIASGRFSTSAGEYTEASGDSSTAFGKHTNASSNSETVVGKYNKLPPREHHHLFTVGNGNESARSDAFFITDQGDVFVARKLIVDGEDVIQDIGTVRSNITKLDKDIVDLKKGVGEINFAVKTNADHLGDSAAGIQELEDKMLEHDSNITNLESENKRLQEELANLKKGTITNHSQEISSLQEEIARSKTNNVEMQANFNEEFARLQANFTALLIMMQDMKKPCICEDKHGCRP